MKEHGIQQVALELVSRRPIGFNPALAEISKSAASGLFLSQLLYWWGKGSDKNWVYKTFHEMRQETYLSRGEQDRAIKKWVELGVLKKEVRGVPPKRYFQIDENRLFDLLKSQSRFAENGISKCDGQQNNTESTSENTNQRFRSPNGHARKARAP